MPGIDRCHRAVRPVRRPRIPRSTQSPARASSSRCPRASPQRRDQRHLRARPARCLPPAPPSHTPGTAGLSHSRRGGAGSGTPSSPASRGAISGGLYSASNPPPTGGVSTGERDQRRPRPELRDGDDRQRRTDHEVDLDDDRVEGQRGAPRAIERVRDDDLAHQREQRQREQAADSAGDDQQPVREEGAIPPTPAAR